jgi:hypothetical protein
MIWKLFRQASPFALCKRLVNALYSRSKITLDQMLVKLKKRDIGATTSIFPFALSSSNREALL